VESAVSGGKTSKNSVTKQPSTLKRRCVSNAIWGDILFSSTPDFTAM
jgi:hypothetical protein